MMRGPVVLGLVGLVSLVHVYVAPRPSNPSWGLVFFEP
jgi:hypothetical protein